MDATNNKAAQGRRVSIGDFSLYLYCAGEGTPSVVFDSGLGDAWTIWSAVLPQVANFTQTCAYDRAGVGESDPATDLVPDTRTSLQMVEELHRLLHNAQITDPFVLVGHSLGGGNVQLYASLYPDEVAGLVLVDPAHEDQIVRGEAILPRENISLMDQFYAMGQEGTSKQSLLESGEQFRSRRALPNVPTIVLAAGKTVMPEGWGTWPLEDMAALNKELQQDLVSRTPQAQLIIAENSGHYIHMEQPELVVEAIRQVVSQVRSAKQPE
jgi:pimeloyl-ACP methyl ester carboxylesterase